MLGGWITLAINERNQHPRSGSIVVPKAAIEQELNASMRNLEHRFRERLDLFEIRAKWLGRLHTYGNVIVIAGGLITSGTIAIGDPSAGWVRAFLITVGLTVGVLTAINQIVRPGRRSATYALAAASLRQEPWDLLLRMGRYETATDDYERTRRFMQEIREVNRQADTPAEDQNSDIAQIAAPRGAS